MEINWNKILCDLEQCIKNLQEYVIEGDFGASISMGTYLTVILSILMVYGIFLSFLQYATKEYSSPLWYMGRDLYKEHLFATNQKMLNLVDQKYVVCLCLIWILPIGAKFLVIGAKSQLLHNILLAMWMVINLFVAGIYAIVFVKCARALIRSMNSKEKSILKSEASAYNNRYMKRCRKMDADEFVDRIRVICKYWNEDEKSETGNYTYNYDSDYLNLINRLIDFYGKKRTRNIDRIRKGKTGKEEKGILYNLRLEINVFNRICEVARKKDVELYEFMQFILKRNTLLKNGIAIYSRSIVHDELYDFDKRNLEELISAYFEIYNYYLKNYKEHNWKMDELMQQLHDDFRFFAELGKDEVYKCASWEVNRVFEKNIDLAVEEKNENALSTIYYTFSRDLETKRWFIRWLDSYVEDNRADMEVLEKTINRIGTEERVYILLHLFFYYSIYDFRFTWKYFDINLLRGLVDCRESLRKEMEKSKDHLIEELKKPMNMWRFNNNMYVKLLEYMQQPMNMEHLALVKEENEIDYKYYFALRVVCWKEHNGYQSYEIKDSKMQRELLTFVSVHPEFFDDRDFRDFYVKIRRENYQKIELGEEMYGYTIEELVLGDFRINEQWIKELIRDNRGPLRNAFNYLVLSCASSYEYEYLEQWIKTKLPYYLKEYDGDKEAYISMLLEIYERYRIGKSRKFEAKLRELCL
ncbi:MAG: hypothetical protein PUJ55_05380 [Clostridiales bacterium]|nr:hypothetical protein [Clostridiaceae bacterium]MDD7636354.1 hypothetical protein [Clostridiales bacterium]